MPYCPECSASVPTGAEHCPTCGSTLIATPSSGGDVPSAAALLDPAGLERELAASLAPRYEVLNLLGMGGMGAVFLAREPALKRLVAIKVLAPVLAADPRARARFEREARAAAALSHPNVVRVYAVGETTNETLPYIIMQYVEGASLAHWMSGRGKVAERDARRIIGEVASALAAAHARDLVHRDVKPGNVLIESDSGRAFVADFGVSAALSPVQDETKLTATGMIVGTPIYMSPEQAAGETISPKSDVYSLGMLGYELLTGELPFKATTTMGWAAAHLRDTPTPVFQRRPDVAPEVARLVDRCLAKNPVDRPTANELARGMLPSLEAEITWPPPGLDWLKGQGRVLARVSMLTLFGGLMTMSALTFTPRILQVHAHWLARFSGAPGVGTGLQRDPGATSQFVWEALLIVGATVFLTGLVVLAVGVGQSADFVLLRLRRGWQWQTLIDLAVDHDGRTGQLLAGAREFASLDAGTRRKVQRARRIRTVAELGSGLWVTAVLVLWALALMTGLVSNVRVASPFSPLLYWSALAPALAFLVVSAVAQNIEARLTAPVRRRPAFVESEADIATWYASAPALAVSHAHTPTGRPRRRILEVGGGIVAGSLLFVVLMSVAAAAAASLVAALTTTRLGPPAAEASAIIARLRAEDPIGVARRALTPYLPPRLAHDEEGTRARLRQLVGLNSTDEPAFPEYADPPASVYPIGFWTTRATTSVQDLLRRAVARQLPRDTLARLQAFGRHPRTTLFRDLVRAEHWDFLDAAGGDRALEAAPASRVPRPNLNRISEAFLANTLAAAGDLGAGRVNAARARLGENAAAGFLLLGTPSEQGTRYGRAMLRSLLVTLSELEQALGEERRALELRQATTGLALLGQLPDAGMSGLLADPASLADATDILRDPRVPAGWRVEMMSRVMDGACTNPREILMGPSPARRATILAASARIRDFHHATALATVATNRWRAAFGPLIERRNPGGVFPRLMACLFGE
jgi:predicted Ser/Thr protein kinase